MIVIYFFCKNRWLQKDIFAFRPNKSAMAKEIINTTNAPAPIGPYNQAVLTGNLLFISGQVALKPGSGELAISDIIDIDRGLDGF